MSRCENNTPKRTNLFVTLNGIPYVLAEYLDKSTIMPVDQSCIKSDVFIDQSESMRAIIDISIDDIGKRPSDGMPAVIGNNTKQKKLLNMIQQNYELLDHELDTMRRGLIVRINYQLENCTTGGVIRSMTEDLRILDRNYFLSINPKEVNDAGIVVNFNTSAVSTINQFTHGRERMKFRITSINLFYESMKRAPKMSHIKNSLSNYNNMRMPDMYGNQTDYYFYHEQMQNRHIMGCDCEYGNEGVDAITPPSWSLFNRFYHFDNGGRDIIYHGEEINDPMSVVNLVPCGSATVNRTFMINPGHRIIFKFSIWKNDITSVLDTTMIAKALRAPLLDSYACGCHDEYHDHDHHDHCDHNHPVDLDYEKMMRMLHGIRKSDIQQNHVINKMLDKINELQEVVLSLIPKDPGTDENPDEPPITVDPSEPSEDENGCGCNCDDEHSKIDQTLEDIRNEINDIREDDAPIPTDMLRNMVEQVW